MDICLVKEKIMKGATSAEIAKDLGVTYGELKQFQLKNSLTRKALGLSKRSSNVYRFSSKQKSVIDGCLLSDAFISKPTPTNLSARFVLASKNKNFVEEVSCLLFGKVLGSASTKNGRSDATYPTVAASGLDFVSQRQRWYPEGVKEVPFDLDLTPDVIRWWYIGDGSVSHVKGKYGTTIRMYLCTDSFSEKSNLHLCKKLEKIGIESSLWKNNRISIKRASQQRFLDFAGYPIQGYEHKWRI